MTDLDTAMIDLHLAGVLGGRVELDADLRVHVVTGSGASTTARVSGHGHRVRIDADRPEVLLAAAGRADARRVAELLAAGGITAEVFGPGGPVATVGADSMSRLGRVVTGSWWISPDAGAALRLARSKPAYRAITAGLGGAVVMASAVTALTLIRRPRRAEVAQG